MASGMATVPTAVVVTLTVRSPLAAAASTSNAISATSPVPPGTVTWLTTMSGPRSNDRSP